MNRFDYVKYDDSSQAVQDAFKKRFMELEDMVNHRLRAGRYTAMVHTKLEEAYMFVGKAIRDDQMARNGASQLE